MATNFLTGEAPHTKEELSYSSKSHPIKIDKELFYKYYIIENHTQKETAEFFQISEQTVLNRIKLWKFNKPRASSVKRVHKDRSAEKEEQIKQKLKANWANKTKEEKDYFKSKWLNARIKNHGSISYNNYTQHKQTCLEKYGNEKYTNRAQASMTQTKNKKYTTKASKKENMLYEALNQKMNLDRQKTFEGCEFKAPLFFDFYRPAYTENFDGLEIKHKDLVIEYDGQQHYFPICFNGSSMEIAYKTFIGTQCKDWYKEYYCLLHDIDILRLKYTEKREPSAEDILKNKEDNLITRKSSIHCFDINFNDFANYKTGCFNIALGISCTFKCEKECGLQICQNHEFKGKPIKNISIQKIITMFNDQSIADAICFQGLEPLDNLKELLWFIEEFRKTNDDNLIIWTGYTKTECEDLMFLIKKMNWKNIIIKFGRYIPGRQSIFDEVLGVTLASNNQFAEKIS